MFQPHSPAPPVLHQAAVEHRAAVYNTYTECAELASLCRITRGQVVAAESVGTKRQTVRGLTINQADEEASE